MGLISEGVDLLKLANKAQNADLYKELAGWIDKVGDLQKQNDQLTAERNELREQVRFKGILERINGHVFTKGDDEELCPRCADVNMKPVHLIMVDVLGRPKATCPECKTALRHSTPKRRHQAQTSSPTIA